MDTATRNAVENDPYPIQVTKFVDRKRELDSWCKHFEKQGVKYTIVLRPQGFAIFRKLTPDEIEELKNKNEWTISGKSFRCQMAERKRPKNEK